MPMCACVYCLCLERRISASNPSASAITVNNQSAKDIDQYFKTELHVKDYLPSKSRNSFYRMVWVNPESERNAEIYYQPWAGFELTPYRYQYDEFSARTEKNSVVYFKTYYIHNYIYNYIYIHSSWLLCLFDVNLQYYASHISRT